VAFQFGFNGFILRSQDSHLEFSRFKRGVLARTCKRS
jgi:hypothetical protein